MSDLGTMEVKVGADIRELLSKVDQAKAKLGQLIESQGLLKQEVKDATVAIQRNDKAIADLTKRLGSMVTNTKEEKAAANTLRNELNELANKGKILNTTLAASKTELAAVTTQIKNQNKEVANASQGSVSFTKNLQGIYTGLSRIAQLIPGLGIGGLVAVLAGPLVEAFAAMAAGADVLEQAQKNLNSTLAEASGSVAGEVTNLRSLVSIAKDTTLSYEARTQAIKAINKEYPDLNKNITLENINTAAVTATINKEIEAIQRRAKVKAIEKLLDEETVKLEKARAEGLTSQMNGFQKALAKAGDVLGAHGLFGTELDAMSDLNKAIGDGTKLVDFYSKKLDELNREGAKAGTLVVPEPDKGGKVKRQIETIADVLAKLSRQISVLNQEEIIFNTSKAQEKIQAIESAIKHLVDKFKLTSNSPLILDLEFRINDIKLREQFKEVLKGKGKIEVPVEFLQANALEAEKLANDFKTQFERKNKQDPPQVGLDINPNINVTDVEDARKKLQLALIGITKGLEKPGKLDEIFNFQKPLEKLQKFSADVNNILNDMNATIAESIGSALGDAFSGTQDVFKSLFSTVFGVLGSALISLGKAAIATAIGIKAIKEAFKSLSPLGALAAGVGLIALGTIIKNQVASAGKGFATGGYVRGAGTKTSDSIAARLSAGEYVIKASTVDKYGVGFFDKLNSGRLNQSVSATNIYTKIFNSLPRFADGGLVGSNLVPSVVNTISNTQQVFIPKMTIHGKDLVTVFNRATTSNNNNG